MKDLNDWDLSEFFNFLGEKKSNHGKSGIFVALISGIKRARTILVGGCPTFCWSSVLLATQNILLVDYFMIET
jgi:hypothetical protein